MNKLHLEKRVQTLSCPLQVQLIAYIRPELKFDGLEPLRAQIEEDCRTARRILDASPDNAPG